MGLVLNVLNDLGFTGFDKLEERLIDVGSEESFFISHFLQIVLNSAYLDSLLRDTFLNKTLYDKRASSFFSTDTERWSCRAIFKTDMVILYAKCKLNVNMGCVGNLCRSVKDLSFEKQRKEANVSKCILPYCYNYRAQLLDVVIQDMPVYECLVSCRSYNSCKLSKNINKNVVAEGERIAKLIPRNDSASIGLVKRETNFIVSDDLVVSAMNSSSTVSLSSKLQMNINDIEEKLINIGKVQAIRASLITTSALTNGLSSFLPKMKPKEATPLTFKTSKSEKIL